MRLLGLRQFPWGFDIHYIRHRLSPCEILLEEGLEPISWFQEQWLEYRPMTQGRKKQEACLVRPLCRAQPAPCSELPEI